MNVLWDEAVKEARHAFTVEIPRSLYEQIEAIAEREGMTIKEATDMLVGDSIEEMWAKFAV